MIVYHLALPDDWARASAAGEYRMSTRGRTLEDEGFVHASTAEQLTPTADRFYGDLLELVLLTVETDRVPAELRWEPPAPGSDERFPHLYGPIPVGAVVSAVAVVRTGDRWAFSADELG